MDDQLGWAKPFIAMYANSPIATLILDRHTGNPVGKEGCKKRGFADSPVKLGRLSYPRKTKWTIDMFASEKALYVG